MAGGNVDAEILRRLGLADAGNVVLLALDRHQAAAADRRRDRPASPRCVISPFGRLVAHEHGLDRLHVIFGRQVHHREIFVVEFAVFLRRIAVALDEMIEHVDDAR